MNDGYSPNWSPGDPLEEDDNITQDAKDALVAESKAAGNWTADDEAAFWEDDQES